MMNRFIAHNMPKIELHCHLDGSMSLPLIQKLMQQEGKEPLGLEELREKLVAPMDCSSLAEYLEKFELPLGCLQTKEGLSAAAQDLALSAAKEQVKYLEVRFAPAFSMEQGLSVREILESVRDGLKKAEEKADILTGMIVCTMRNLETEKNIAMLKEAREFLGNGVVAVIWQGMKRRTRQQRLRTYLPLQKNMACHIPSMQENVEAGKKSVRPLNWEHRGSVTELP